MLLGLNYLTHTLFTSVVLTVGICKSYPRLLELERDRGKVQLFYSQL